MGGTKPDCLLPHRSTGCWVSLKEREESQKSSKELTPLAIPKMTKDKRQLSDMHRAGIFVLSWMGCKFSLMHMLSAGSFHGHIDKDWWEYQDSIARVLRELFSMLVNLEEKLHLQRTSKLLCYRLYGKCNRGTRRKLVLSLNLSS